MAKEIERKFLVNIQKWTKSNNFIEIEQAYIAIDDKIVVRVRISGHKAFLTIKGNLQGIVRDEFEYEIPVNDAHELMKMRIGFTITKKRYYETLNGFTWEIDVFENENKGLVVAEIELKNENDTFDLPVWAGEEVSTDNRYFNFNLSKTPFAHWQ